MGDLSNRDVLNAPFALAGTMLSIGLATAIMANVDSQYIIGPYFSAAMAVAVLCLLCSVFWWVLQLARRRAEAPLAAVTAIVGSRAVLMALPAVALPLFLVGYTTSKTAIPFLVGYGWDRFWADADSLIFGADAWRITHGWLGSRSMLVWEWFYTVGWGTVFFFTSALVSLHAERRTIAIFFTAMLATWLIGGWFLAYVFSAAGPVFAHLFDPSLTDRFGELRQILEAELTRDGSIRRTQGYLLRAVDQHTAVMGGGISAMPSMHLGAASIYVLAAWRTKWLVPACLFWIVIFIGSAYFGYHYWIDGILVVPLAYACWRCSAAYHKRRPAALSGAMSIA